MKATLTELNSNSNALARAAQAGETVVITDRGRPIADIVPHRQDVWVTRPELVKELRVLRGTRLSQDTSEQMRAETDAVIDPYLDLDAAR